MEPVLQWILTIIGGLIGVAIVAAVKALYGIRMELSELKHDLKDFIGDAEGRFEHLESRVDDIEAKL